ncbi:MAG: hypothetical protein CMA37_04625 [Euryarchaeota archaeon]|nr:hypothetical protein [Euryarchaeota archaeon]|tara:strand:- start:34 stop:1173 length:1140 start_codon:yes stop_codon:yes gene_type:complete
MSGDDRFEILLTPETGDGVSTHAQKFIDSSPDGLNLVAKNVPHIETAIELLLDGHGDIVPVSGEWWSKNRNRELSTSLVLPRREPTRVLVGEDKPEYIPKKGIIVADCEIIKRQLHRSRGDIVVKLASEMEGLPDDQFERVEWLENLRIEEKIDGFITTRSLHSSLSSKPRRHTLGMQRQDDSRARFIPVPLEGYTVLLTRKDFPASRFSKVIDVGAALSFRLELTVLDSIEDNLKDKIALVIEQRKVRTILQDVGNRGKSLGFENPLKEWKTFTGGDTHQGPKDSDPRIDVILETISKDGTVTTSVERIFPIDESHSGIQTLLVNWHHVLKIAREVPEEEKRGRMKELMDEYIDKLVSEKRISEDRIYSPMFKDNDHN